MGKTLNNFGSNYFNNVLSMNMKEIQNAETYLFYYSQIRQLVKGIFTWNNLVDGITEKFIEDSLFEYGSVVFFKENNMLCCGRCAEIGYNKYNEPTYFDVYFNNGETKRIKSEDGVICWNKYDRQPSVYECDFVAKRLNNIQLTIDSNLEHLKNPYILFCSEGQKNTFKEMIKKKSNNEPYILADKSLSEDFNPTVFDLHINDFATNLTNLRDREYNNALTMFGINNVNIQKKERLNVNETTQNDEQININLDSRFKERRKACEEIQKKWGYNINVTLSADYYKEEGDFTDE